MTSTEGRRSSRSPQSVKKKATRRPKAAVLIRGGWVILDNEVARLDVRIDGTTIRDIGKKLSGRGVARVIDAKGMIVMPGLVQAHTQVCHTLFRGQPEGLDALGLLRERIWPLEGALLPEELRAAARLGFAELLMGGTTSVLDMGPVVGCDILFEEAKRMGIRYVGGKAIMDHGQGYPAALRESTEGALQESARLCQKWHDSENGRLRYAFSPRTVMCCSDAALRGAVEAARHHGALIHTQAAESADEVTVVRDRTGHGPIQHLHALGVTGSDVVVAHGIWMSMVERRMLQETHTRVVHCPSANLRLGSGIARVPEMLADGIMVGLGSASAAHTGHLDGFAEMRLAALIHKGRGGAGAISSKLAFDMATRNGAEAIGLKDVGSLEIGKRADVVVLDANRPHLQPLVGDLLERLVFAACARDVHTVMVDGKMVVDEGRLLTGGQQTIIRQGNQRAKAVAARID